MTAAQKDITIAGLVRQIDENNNRIGTLTAENARLTRDLVAVQAQRDTANAALSAQRRTGW